jgi:hypothetical protein
MYLFWLNVLHRRVSINWWTRNDENQNNKLFFDNLIDHIIEQFKNILFSVFSIKIICKKCINCIFKNMFIIVLFVRWRLFIQLQIERWWYFFRIWIFRHLFDYHNTSLRISQHFSSNTATPLRKKLRRHKENTTYSLAVLAASKSHDLKKSCEVY